MLRLYLSWVLRVVTQEVPRFHLNRVSTAVNLNKNKNNRNNIIIRILGISTNNMYFYTHYNITAVDTAYKIHFGTSTK